MFQSFDDSADPTLGRERAARLRTALAEAGVDGFLIPRADEHQGEYVPPHAERLAWLTGFSGSAGLAIILENEAAIFVDGRYTLQVRTQVDTEVFEPQSLFDTPPAVWVERNLPSGAKLGFDPWLHTVAQVKRYREAVKKAGGDLVPVANLVDEIWTDQPEPPLAPFAVHEERYAGEPFAAKLDKIAGEIGSSGADAVVLTMPDSIAWLFNIRGRDVSHSPLPLSFALVEKDGSATLFADPRKYTDELRTHLGNRVELAGRDALGPALDRLGVEKKTVRLDPNSCADWIARRLAEAGAELSDGVDPCELPKALKNAAEVAGAKAAHERDGVALTRFLHWLSVAGATGAVDEITAAQKLEAFRADTGELKDLSFDTISGAGENGAIVHYRVTKRTVRPLRSGDLYLVDSGGQYLDGTTDVTRTVAIGAPTSEAAERFTLVLKGHIAIARARFPKGTSGAQLDALARMPLWQAGLDFDHGTGHGVGSYLSVHEGPQRISKFGTQGLEPGMIVSNEPGYYKTGAYGIRIENLLVVTEAAPVAGGERAMLGFETLTLAPIDRALIVADMLDRDERAWLNAYHARVREVLAPKLDAEAASWLTEATAPV